MTASGRRMAAALVLLLGTRAASAQEPRVLEGTVIAVQGDRARLEITSTRLPSQGDSVWLGIEMAGVGDVMLDGRWRVAEVQGSYAWVDPVGEVAKPLPGYAAAIFSDHPVDAPEEAAPGVEVLFGLNFLGGDTSDVVDGPYCRTRNTPAGYVIRTVAESGGCTWNWWNSGVIEPPAKISTVVHLRGGDLSWGYGLQFGTEDRSSTRYYVLLVSGNGSYSLARSDPDGWSNLTGWVEHPAVATGLGARNELTVELEGRAIHYAVNGVHLGSLVEPEPVIGYLGFYLNDPGHEIVFEGIRAERINAATPRTSTEALLLEDFGDAGAWRDRDGPPCRTRHTGDGFSVQNVASSGTCYWNLWRAGSFEPAVRIEAEVQYASGPDNNGYGIKFATVDQDNSDYYAFLVSGNGYWELRRWEDGAGYTQPLPWTQSDAVNSGLGASNRLTVELRGNEMDLYVNGRFMQTYHAPRDLGGYLALFINAPDLAAVFKELKVEPLGRR